MENCWLLSDCFRLQCRRPWFDSWVRKIHCKRDKLLTPVFLGFPCGSAGKESACDVGDLGLIPGKIHWRREWLPIPVFWPREFHGESVGSQRVRHDWATFTSTQIVWRNEVMGQATSLSSILGRQENPKELQVRSPYLEQKPLESQTGRNI